MAKLSELLKGMKGDDGLTPELQATATHIQWRYAEQTPEDTWKDLIAISELQGDEGLSAYEVWLLEGNVGTELDYLVDIKGSEGLSAYEVWILEGNEGTEQDFFNSIGGTTVVFIRSATTPDKPANSGYDVPYGGWSRTVEIAGIDKNAVEDGIRYASTGLSSAEELFITAEAIVGRSLGDVNDDGAVNTMDAFEHYHHGVGNIYVPYINDYMHPYIVANKATYIDYFDETGDLYMAVGKNTGSGWVWDEPVKMVGESNINIDGGTADSVYTAAQVIDGGTA